MRFAGRAHSWAKRAETDFLLGNVAEAQVQSAEAVRLAGSAGKLMLTVTDAALVLDKLRHGAKQTVTVRHLTVSNGGQAIVAGAVRGGSRRCRQERGSAPE